MGLNLILLPVKPWPGPPGPLHKPKDTLSVQNYKSAPSPLSPSLSLRKTLSVLFFSVSESICGEMGAGREVQSSLDGLRDKNVMQLKKLNTALFPVRYNDKYYADALASGDFTKLG